jgi:hypothetical protein
VRAGLQLRVVKLGCGHCWELTVVSLSLNEKLFPPEEPVEGLEGEELRAAVKAWFLLNFEDPAESTPYNGQEGGAVREDNVYLHVFG